MCGICGYIGYNNAFNIVYNGILKLLNRGYDSIGITTINNNNILTHKYASYDNEESIENKLIKHQYEHNGTIGIAHSRWRVVGGKTDNNSHPHHDCFNNFSIVHNGIIENYKDLKTKLIDLGYKFKSETDSEVIANLISYHYNKLTNNNNLTNNNLQTHDLTNNNLQTNDLTNSNLHTNDLTNSNLHTNDLTNNNLHTNDLTNNNLHTNDLFNYDLTNNNLQNNDLQNNDLQNNIINAINNTLSQLHGTFALCIISKNHPNKLFCARRGSPLIIGFDENKTYAMVVSEKSAFNKNITNCFHIDNHDLITIDKTQLPILITSNTNTNYQSNKVIFENEQTTCYPFSHWTLKEIYEQKDSCLRAIALGNRISNDSSVKLGGLESNINNLSKCNNIIFAGCGTSFHAGLYASNLFKKICNFNTVQVFDGAEMTNYDIPKVGKTCVVFISQSGETKDLHRCLEMCREINKNNVNNKLDNNNPFDNNLDNNPFDNNLNNNSFDNNLNNNPFNNNTIETIGVVNVVDSLIAREVDCGVYLNCGKEYGVASTKAFSSQIIVLTLIALWFSEIQNCKEETRKYHINLIRKLSYDIETTIENNLETCKQIGKYLVNKNSMFVLGKGQNESIAKEGSLKIKELGYIHCEGYSSSALKHGPYTLITNETPVILLTPNDEHFIRNQGTTEELLSRNATIIGISDGNLNENYYYKIKIPKDSLFEVLATLPLQLIGYFLAIEKGHNPDFLRGLAKTVTTD